MPLSRGKEPFVIYKVDGFRHRKMIAGFDLDHTLIKPKSKAVIPKDIDDWQWLKPEVPEVIRGLYKKGYCIMVFTNQTFEWRVQQVKNIIDALGRESGGIPLKAFILFGADYRKPEKNIWEQEVTKEWDKKKSFYCGDALGRHADWSDVDRGFANNVGIGFKSPEEIFSGGASENEGKKDCNGKRKPCVCMLPDGYREVVVMVGFPGSGKTTLALDVFGGTNRYVILHGDDLKTSKKMISVGRTHLEAGKSVVFDATNPSRAKRAEFIGLAKEFGVSVRCIYVSTGMDESIKRNNEREKGVPRIAYNMYKKGFEMPDISEGCSVVIV